VANTISKFQLLVVSGFVMSWWDSFGLPALMIASLFGFVIYRYRQTRAMTVGQFFEMRYSRNFRKLTGVLGFIAGILNYGIFPAVASNFFVHFLGLPMHTPIGPWQVPTTSIVMVIYLSSCLWMMLMGGTITLIVTNCIDGILSHLVYVLMIFAIFYVVGWSGIRHMMLSQPRGYSMVDPFDQSHIKDFNFFYPIIYWSMYIYQTMSVQKDNSYSAAARNPHEALMGGVLGNWRMLARNVMLVVVALGALTYLKGPNFPGAAALGAIHDSQTYDQMKIPISLSYMLPVGIKGLFLTIMILGMTDGDSAHILTWGGIFIQDVVLPIRGKPLTPKQHVRVLRWSVTGVAVFALFFSSFFTQTQYISMWWAVTEAIFVSGAGAAIIGGLYWSKGTTPAAWSAIVVGSTLAVTGILAPIVLLHYGRHFPFNGMQMKFIAAAAAVLVYVVVSLLTCRDAHDMDKLLRRGRYAIADDKIAGSESRRRQPVLARLMGINQNFTLADKLVTGGLFFWCMLSMAIVLVGTVWNLAFRHWSQETWVTYWFAMGVVVPLIIAVVTMVWFGVGGVIDLRKLFKRLATMSRDSTDDGTVNQHTTPAPARLAAVSAPSNQNNDPGGTSETDKTNAGVT